MNTYCVIKVTIDSITKLVISVIIPWCECDEKVIDEKLMISSWTTKIIKYDRDMLDWVGRTSGTIIKEIVAWATMSLGFNTIFLIGKIGGWIEGIDLNSLTQVEDIKPQGDNLALTGDAFSLNWNL